MGEAIVEVLGLRKEFPGVVALRDVSLSFARGEVHGLVGENGAGKSTLMKILAGVYRPTAGQMRLPGGKSHWKNVADAQAGGVVMIHQELNLVDELSVAENIFLGRESTVAGLVKIRKLRDEAGKLLALLQADVHPASRVKDLSVAQKQLVEIAKAVSCQASLLIMDEPTAVLTAREAESLFKLIAGLKVSGVTVAYISHILPDVLRICDRVTVMRDGQVVKTLGEGELRAANERQLASLMVGRPMADHFPPRDEVTGGVVLKLNDISVRGRVRGVSLEVRAGEIFGLAGLIGAGRTELGEAIAGLRKRDGGRVVLYGRDVAARRPADAVSAGIAYLSEDRKGRGLTLPMSTAENVVMVSLKRYSAGLLRLGRQAKATRDYVEKLHIKVADIDDPVANLSGGNQQKVSLAKWLETNPRVLILDEPTRGVDIGAKEEIYRLIKQLAQGGMACLMISSEFNELLGTCHRIGVMREGRLIGIVPGQTATEEQLMHMASGIVTEPKA